MHGTHRAFPLHTTGCPHPVVCIPARRCWAAPLDVYHTHRAQALLGTNWNDAIDVLDLGLDALDAMDDPEADGRSVEMEAEIDSLPPGSKVRYGRGRVGAGSR